MLAVGNPNPLNCHHCLETYIEENSGEDSPINSARNEKGGFSQKDVNAQIKMSTDQEETDALKKLLALIKAESTAKSAEKTAKAALDRKVFEAIPKLSEDSAKTLTVNDKWLATVENKIGANIERPFQN